MKTCPTCGRSLPDPKRPKRVCWRCGRQICKNEKWQFGESGRAEHRCCEDPTSYGPAEAPVAKVQQELLERTEVKA